MNIIRNLLVLVIAFNAISPSISIAAEVFTVKEFPTNSKTQEFYAGTPGTVMMKVNLLGAVTRPGVYNVPLNTDLPQLIAFSGGATVEADLDEISIRRQDKEKYTIQKIDFEDFFDEEATLALSQLKPDDYIYVPHQPQAVSIHTMRTTTAIAAIFGILVSSILLEDRLKR